MQSGSSSSAIVSNKNEPSPKDMMNLSSDSAQTDLYVTDILTPESVPEALNFSTYALETVLPHEKVRIITSISRFFNIYMCVCVCILCNGLYLR